MAYIFRLKVEKDKSSLALFENETVEAAKEWPEGRDMGRRLFQAIEELLVENGLNPEDVAEFEVVSDIPEIYTSARIAETVKRVYTYSVRTKRNSRE